MKQILDGKLRHTINKPEPMIKSNNEKKDKVFLHIGLGRTGSDFIQKKVFPKFSILSI